MSRKKGGPDECIVIFLRPKMALALARRGLGANRGQLRRQPGMSIEYRLASIHPKTLFS